MKPPFPGVTLTVLAFCFFAINLTAQKLHSDNGDGTYTNPVIASDFPGPDVILVDDTYYMVATTMLRKEM